MENDWCEMWGEDADLVCMCKNVILCSNCLGKHVLNNPSPNHTQAPLAQREIRRALSNVVLEMQEIGNKAYETEMQRQKYDESLRNSIRLKLEVAKEARDQEIEKFRGVVAHLHEQLELSKDEIIRKVENKYQLDEQQVNHALSIIGTQDEYSENGIISTADITGNIDYTFNTESYESMLEQALKTLGLKHDLRDQPILSQNAPSIGFDPYRLSSSVQLTNDNKTFLKVSKDGFGTAVLNTYFDNQDVKVTIFIDYLSGTPKMGLVEEIDDQFIGLDLNRNRGQPLWIWWANGDMDTNGERRRCEDLRYGTDDTLWLHYSASGRFLEWSKGSSPVNYRFTNVSRRVLFVVNSAGRGMRISLQDITVL